MRVKNRKIIRTLTWRSLRAGKFRNTVAICAIALTAVLFTTVFALGGNIIASMQNTTMRQVGTSAHGGLKYLTQEQYDNFTESHLIRDISYNIIIGIAENESLRKKQTEIRYSEDKNAEWGFSYPTVGTMPRSGKDLACSTITLDMLGIPHELGQKVPLEFTVHGTKYSEEFTLCGFWPGDDVMQATQVWLSRDYTDSIISIPTSVNLSDGFEGIAGTINANVWFANSLDIEGKMDALLREHSYQPGEISTGVNWAYIGGDVDPTSAVIAVFLILLILVSGYLIIYSVFSISVAGDIRFYGLLKTIGATGRQLRRVVLGQALVLSAVGIPLGLALGWLLGYGLTPVVMSTTNLSEVIAVSASPFIFIFAAVFSLVTVYISCRKPGRIAAKVSPVEAVRYTEAGTGRRHAKRAAKVSSASLAWANIRRTPKKLVLVVFSLSLSLILLNSVHSIVQGFDMEMYLHDQIASDFSVADHSVYSAISADDNFEGIDDAVLDEIAGLSGLEDFANIYFYDDYLHQLSPRGHIKMVEALDFLAPLIEKYWPHTTEQVDTAKETGIASLHVYGAGQLASEIIAESVDFDKLSSGNYALVASLITSDNESERRWVYETGDMIPLINSDGELREFEVLAVIPSYPYSMYCGHSHIIESTIVLADNVYLDFYGDRQPMMTLFNVEDEYIPNTEHWISNYCETINTDLNYRSRDFYINEYNKLQNTFYALGGTLSFILALIGLLNFVNAVFTSIFARRRELAMLQSVGMTGRQLKSMMFYEGAFHAALTVLITATAGSLLSYAAIHAIARNLWFFTWSFTLMPLVCAAAPLVFICAIVPLSCYRFMGRESIVDRLRETG